MHACMPAVVVVVFCCLTLFDCFGFPHAPHALTDSHLHGHNAHRRSPCDGLGARDLRAWLEQDAFIQHGHAVWVCGSVLRGLWFGAVPQARRSQTFPVRRLVYAETCCTSADACCTTGSHSCRPLQARCNPRRQRGLVVRLIHVHQPTAGARARTSTRVPRWRSLFRLPLNY